MKPILPTELHNECEDLIYQLLDHIHQLRLVMENPPAGPGALRTERELLRSIGDRITSTGQIAREY
jgi:hypothetical protein